ncbi:Copper chaperone CopZ [compost metagenome]
MSEINLKVNGMSCQHCVNSVEGAIKKLGATATVDLPGKSVSVSFDESKLSLETIKETIEEQGYDVV